TLCLRRQATDYRSHAQPEWHRHYKQRPSGSHRYRDFALLWRAAKLARDHRRSNDSACCGETGVMKSKLVAMFASLALAFAAPAHAQKGDKPLFAASDPIHIVVQAPLSSITRNREGHDAIAGTLTDPNGQSLPISLAIRGITRRTSEICDFPPLRVDFTAPPAATSVFAGQRRLKLVTHCRNAASFQQYVLLEYSAYR